MRLDEPSNLPRTRREPQPLGNRDRVHVLIEEYRALYGLLSFRLAAVDQRLPIVGGALTAVLGSVSALPDDSQLGVLLAMPVALAWLLRMTVYHARSKEDVLRRIDEVERQVNQIAGEELLAFQSRHPSRQRTISGRTGMGTVSSVLSFCLAGLLGCVALMVSQQPADARLLAGYVAYVAVAALDFLHLVLRLRRYRYAKAAAERSPLFRAWIAPETSRYDPNIYSHTL